VLTEGEGLPGLTEINADCGLEVYKAWIDQPLCSATASGLGTSACKGYYLYYIGSHPAEREVVVELPPASATLSLTDCAQIGYQTICPLMPSLHITGVEPLPDYAITQLNYHIDAPPNFRDESGICESAVCEVPLSLTTLEGERISFWADSSYGDSSQHYEVSYRVKPTEDGRWEVDILGDEGLVIKDETSEQDRFSVYRNQAMSVQWQAFPPLGENPIWLSYPADAAALASGEPYQYLAGRLIDARIE
jgi:hypothetical protein